MFNLFGKKKPGSIKLFEDGIKLYHAGNYKQAESTLSEALIHEKEKSESDKQLLSNIHNIRGEVYLSVGVAILSQSDFVTALDLNPENESALNNLGIWFSIAAFATPDYSKSLSYFDKAISINPNRNDIILNRAIVKIQSGDKSGCTDLEKLDTEGYADAKIAIERFCI